ncbi:MAG: HNH endonuclease [Bacteroidales bacterium]|nr:HNH endonuclease [Bacteroidales bacterium]
MGSKRTIEDFKDAVAHSFSIAGMCRHLGLRPSGGNYKLMHNAIDKYNLDTRHFRGQGWNVGLNFKPNPAISIDKILVKESTFQSYKLKNRLLNEGLKSHICECCGLKTWQDKQIPLELHHINGDNRDNRLENLQLLCPNCHALTDSYRGKNNKSRKV